MQSNPSSTDEFFKKNYNTSIAFAVAVLLFLLPFVEIRCNDAPIARNTGLGLAIGSDFKSTGNMKSLENSFKGGSRSGSEENNNEGKFYLVALISLLAGIAGVVISYGNRGRHITNIILGLLAAVSLIILLIQVKSDVSRSPATSATGQFGREMKFEAEFTPWFYFSLVCFLTAAFFTYRKMHLVKTDDEEPPKNAPQLDLPNRGDQSEFPRAASESEIG